MAKVEKSANFRIEETIIRSGNRRFSKKTIKL